MSVKRLTAVVSAASIMAAGCGSSQSITPPQGTERPSHSVDMPPPPPAVETFEGFSLGATLYDLDDQELGERLDRIKTLGASVNMLRLDIDWAQVQPEANGLYQWENTDRVVSAAKKRGFHILAMVGFAPEWARDPACAADYACAPSDPQAFADFAKEAATHLGEDINHWEIWNEPNTAKFLGEKADVPRYAAMLTLATHAIKTVQGDAKVAAGGVAPGYDDGKNIAPVTFLGNLYELGAMGSVDAVALHPYSIPAAPSQPAKWNSFTQLDGGPKPEDIPNVYSVLEAHDDVHTKEIWLTEYGAPTAGGATQVTPENQRHFIDNGFENGHVTEPLQATMIKDFLTYPFKDGMNVPIRIVYTDEDTAPYGESTDTENYFGVWRSDGTPKPVTEVFGQ